MDIFGIHHVALDDTDISGIQSLNVNNDVGSVYGDGSGLVDPKMIATMAQGGGMSFDSLDLATVLSTIDLDGFVINATNTFKMYFEKYEEGGTLASAGELMTVNKGLAVINSINASQGSEATISVSVVPTWDGTNDPIVNSSAAPSGTISENIKFTLGKVKLNGSFIEPQSISLDYGYDLITRGKDGDVFPSHVGIRRRVPTITIETLDLGELTTYLNKGVPMAGDNYFFFRKLSTASVARVADATEEHIKFTINQGQIINGGAGGSKGSEATTSLILKPTWDGSNNILVYDTTAAIA